MSDANIVNKSEEALMRSKFQPMVLRVAVPTKSNGLYLVDVLAIHDCTSTYFESIFMS